MNITSAKYHALMGDTNYPNASITIIVDGKTLSVPIDPDNTDYQAIIEWASQDGNTIADAD